MLASVCATPYDLITANQCHKTNSNYNQALTIISHMHVMQVYKVRVTPIFIDYQKSLLYLGPSNLTFLLKDVVDT